MTEMPTLSIQQPWAWAIVHGPKRIENRTWHTDYRGPLLIHTGKSRDRIGDFGDVYDSTGFIEPPSATMDFGAIIGVCDLVDCLNYKVNLRAHVLQDPFAEGPWCWILDNVRPMPAVPYVGQRGLFRVDVVWLCVAAGWPKDFATSKLTGGRKSCV